METGIITNEYEDGYVVSPDILGYSPVWLPKNRFYLAPQGSDFETRLFQPVFYLRPSQEAPLVNGAKETKMALPRDLKGTFLSSIVPQTLVNLVLSTPTP